MCRKWKKAAALGLAVLIGGMMPMSTMLAAEDNTEVAQEMETDSVPDADAVPDDEAISDDNESLADEMNAEEENTGDEGNADDGNIVEEANADDENVVDEANADDENVGDEVNVDDMIADDEVNADNGENAGFELMAAAVELGAENEEDPPSTAASVIDIEFDGQSSCYALGGTIDYVYVNNKGKSFEILPGQGVKYYYYLDRAEKVTDPSKEEGQLVSLWSSEPERDSFTMGLGDEQNYVLYVKAIVEADGQTTYARSCGVVVDTTAPKIVGIEEGKTYPAGTTFTVSDANLDVVMVNEKVVEPESDGSYRVRANGTSCMIRVKDKAKNESTCSITVFGGDPEEDPAEDTVISESKVYALKAGVKYHLAAGKWRVDGDKSVYQGDSDFYVKEDGDYKFSK